MMWVWFGIAVALFVVEIATADLVAVWFALSSMVLGIITGVASGLDLIWQILIFVILSAVLLVATRPFAKWLKRRAGNAETNLELVLNHKGIVVEEINNDLSEGAVKINGLVWSARSVNGEIIENGALVTVKEIHGNKAIVSKE
ncbi:MAG: NfeD family protein [Clostridiales bacterium]|nr:NfeD family protein [Clostridiales bacterium]